jgi:hypothetical protein
MAETNYDADYDEYENLEASAAAVTPQPSGNNQRRPQQVMNDQDMGLVDEEMDGEEIEAEPEPKPVKQRPPHNSNMNARDRKPIPVINPKTGRPVVQKSTEEELQEISAEEEVTEEEAEANQLAAEEKMPRWMPFHQPEKIGLINTETKEIIEGFKDTGSAAGMARILNEIGVMIVSGGFQ